MEVLTPGKWPLKPRLAWVALLLSMVTAAAAQQDQVVSPQVAAPPQIDGKLGDAAWPTQPQITYFGVASNFAASPKAISGWLCHDDTALYMAFKVMEPKPELLKRGAEDGSRGVWKDDSLEIFIRAGDSSLDFDQFIVNSAGARQSERARNGVHLTDWTPKWPAAGAVGADHWTVELAIPFAVLEIPAPTPGTMVQLGIGREDYTKTGPQLVNWPAGLSYGGMGGYGKLFFVSDNLLANPDFSQQQDGKVARWTFGAEDAPLFASVSDAGKQVVRFQTPNRYAVAQQGLRLKPNTTYQLSAQVKGLSRISLRARSTARKTDTASQAYSVESKISDQYQPIRVSFPSGESGSVLIIVGTVEGFGRGDVFISDLRVSQEPASIADGPAIPVPAGKPVRVSKLLVSDCRAARGFVTAPVDGRLNSYNWNVDSWEYNQRGAGAGVGYGYNNNEGLHIALGDRGGVDAVQIRDGAKVKLYTGADSFDAPGKAPLLWDFPGKAKSSRALFDKRIMSDRFSFFELTDGRIADCTFLRVSPDAPKGRPGTTLYAGSAAAPGPVAAAAESRFTEADRSFFSLQAAPQPLKVEPRQTIHLVSAPLAAETPLDALSLQFALAGEVVNCPVTIGIQDAINPLHELMGVDADLTGGKQFEVVCDFPDQVIPAGKVLWLTLTFGAPVQLDQLAVRLHELTREQAVPEALAYRKLLMRGLFCQLSESRQWGGIRANSDLEKFYTENRWGEGIRQLHAFIAHCKDLGPQDDLVRVYDEWVWRSARELPPWEVKLDSMPGAPEWATLLRQSWLANRAVCQWWLDNRLAPSGEFGGLVGDDTDMYQNYADLPMLESGGTGAAIVAAAEKLADLAEKENLEFGLNRHSTDPLHAYEEGVNHESLMLWWKYGDPVYFERCLLAAKSLPATTVLTDKGHRHFKSQVIGSEDLRINREPDADGGAHNLMWHPALEVAWYNRSPQVLKYLDEWASGWLEHNEPGKYASMVDVKTDTTKTTHYRPLYGYGQASCNVWLYFMTGKDKYLDPFMYYFQKGETQLPMKGFIPELWHHGYLDSLPNKDLWLGNHPVTAAAGLGNKQALVDALKTDLTELQRFGWMYTGAEVFTDRVFLSTLYNTAIAYTGGYATRNKFNHTEAVSWEGLGTDYAALVLQGRPESFKALVYNFSDKPLQGRMRLWTLDHGRYRLTQGADANADDAMDQATRTETLEVARATALPITLAPKQVTVIELAQVDKLDDLTARPDLAISPLTIKIESGAIRGTIHNIGGSPAERFVVRLLDAQGKQQASQVFGPLAAPLDLEPKRLEFSFPLKSNSVKGWKIVVDPENAVPEIYEGNNEVVL